MNIQEFSIIKKILVPEKKKLLENLLSLSTLSVVSYLFPLITVPYLVRVLGVEKFGLISFAQAFNQYFLVLTDYGFNLSATQEIARARNDREKISKIFSAVLTIKTALLFLSFFVLVLLTSLIPKFSEDSLLYIYSFGAVIASILFPVWVFQGIENMKHITLLNILSRSLFTILIFFFVKSENDYLYVPILTALGGIVAGVLSLIIIQNKFKIRYQVPTFGEMREQLVEGWHVFLSQVSVSLYSASNIFILGLLSTNVQVGYFVGINKIIQIIKSMINPITQSLFPYVNRKMDDSKEGALDFIKKISFPLALLFSVCSLVFFILAPLIVRIILGTEFEPAIIILRVMSFIPLFVILSNIMGIQVMLPLQYKKQFSNIILIAGIINVLLLFVLIPQYEALGVGISVLLTEMFVTVTMFVFLKRRNINIFKRV